MSPSIAANDPVSESVNLPGLNNAFLIITASEALNIRLLLDDNVGCPVPSVEINELAATEPLTLNDPLTCKSLEVA